MAEVHLCREWPNRTWYRNSVRQRRRCRVCTVSQDTWNPRSVPRFVSAVCLALHVCCSRGDQLRATTLWMDEPGMVCEEQPSPSDESAQPHGQSPITHSKKRRQLRHPTWFYHDPRGCYAVAACVPG